MKTVLIIATMDTKHEEALYLKKLIESSGCRGKILNTGIINPFDGDVEISSDTVSKAGCGLSTGEMLKKFNKGECISFMTKGTSVIAKQLYENNGFDAVIGIGGGQGTDIGTSAMKVLPFGVPKLMVSTVASGRAMFGPFVGTKDIMMMHSVCDIQGLNIVTRKVFENAAAAICAMANTPRTNTGISGKGKGSVAVSMLGTTTPGALKAKELLEEEGFDFVAFHQNGTGGIAMEEMIEEGLFKGVLDINLHEIGDSYFGGLHGSIREGRLESAARTGLPQVIAPGSINYAVVGPYGEVSDDLKKRKHIIHNSYLTLVRLTPEEMTAVGRITAEKINRSTGKVHVYIPLKGFSFPDTEGREHWDPEGNNAFIVSLKNSLKSDIPYDEVDLHINDEEFIETAVNKLFSFIK